MDHGMRGRRLEALSHKMKAIKELKARRNVTDLKSFAGLCNAPRQVPPGLEKMESLSNDRIRNDKPFKLEVKSLPEKFVPPSVLALSYVEEQMTLDTYACDFQIRCAIFQEQHDKSTKLIGYLFCLIGSADRVYDMTQRDLLTIVCAVLIFLPRFEGTRCTLGSITAYRSAY